MRWLLVVQAVILGVLVFACLEGLWPRRSRKG